MIKLIMVLLVVVISGCSPLGSGNDANPEKTYRTVIIEEHEYIFISRRPWSSEMAIAHKANCRFH